IVDRGAAVALTALVGGCIALQAPINSHLGKSVGTFQAAFVSFAIGTLLLAAIAAVAKGGMAHVGEARHVAWYYLTGGVLGAAYVTTVLVTVRSLGAGGVVAATIAGQLSMSVVVDHFGWLGVERHTVSVARLAGVALLAAGVFLIVRD
ncbi:MAG TPA: DMT family transporter, partial [Solirubrobacteraceae bacterium]